MHGLLLAFSLHRVSVIFFFSEPKSSVGPLLRDIIEQLTICDLASPDYKIRETKIYIERVKDRQRDIQRHQKTYTKTKRYNKRQSKTQKQRDWGSQQSSIFYICLGNDILSLCLLVFLRTQAQSQSTLKVEAPTGMCGVETCRHDARHCEPANHIYWM